MNSLKYLAWIALVFLGLMVGGVLLFIFVIPNPLGVTDGSTIAQANAFGINEGIRTRDFINKNSTCPENLVGWSSESRRSKFQYEISIPKDERAGRAIPIWYTCDENLDFEIFVRHSIDSSIWVTGGKEKNIKIQYGHFTDPKEILLTAKMTKVEIIHVLLNSKLITNESSGRIQAPHI